MRVKIMQKNIITNKMFVNFVESFLNNQAKNLN